eukprot:comp20531_c1_seq1/m.26317 comp20531_c1_seq1/g.26317  ORF comp20531_c1_seq1/g.26317 comp20531_c1_seq1/m.26317 type:complete len:298 (-) comp20531_c1_seq1:190-1083(-)
MAVTVTGPVAMWRPTQPAKRGLQIALETPLPDLVHNVSERNLVSLQPAKVDCTASLSTDPSGVQASALSVVQGINALTAPLMAVMKADTATEMFWGVYNKVKSGLSAFVPVTVSISFKSSAPIPVPESTTAPAASVVADLPIPLPPSLPEEREQEILKQLCASADNIQPLIFSARSVEGYVAARKASQEASQLQMRQQHQRKILGLGGFFGHGRVFDPRPFVQFAFQKVLVETLWAPVASLTIVDMRPSTLSSWMASPETTNSSSRDNRWVQRGMRLLGAVLVYDAVLLGVAYMLCL